MSLVSMCNARAAFRFPRVSGDEPDWVQVLRME